MEVIMSSKLFKAVSTGVGVGLLAATLSTAASAASVNQSWSSGMIFYKGGSTPTYVINVPTGNSSTDYTLIVELASTVSNLNAFSIGYEFGGLSATSGEKQGLALFSATNDTNHAVVSWVNSHGSTVQFNASDSASTNGAPGLIALWNGVSSTWLTAGASSYTQSLSGNLLFGTGTAAIACPYSMTAALALNGNLSIDSATNHIFAPMSSLVSNYSTATSGGASLWFPLVTKTSGLAAGDWTSYNTQTFSAWDAQTNGSIAVPSSLFKVAYTTSGASLGTVSSSNLSNGNWPSTAPSVLSKINTCNGVYANRTALNNSGLIIGGNNGLSRIW
jgi:hypothetical protein